MRVVHFVCLGIALGAALAASGSAIAQDARYARVLSEFTVEVGELSGTRVNYAELRRSALWAALLAELGAADPARSRSDAERLAFWINAYNILAIDLVVRHYPVESIRDIGSFLAPVWTQRAGRIGGRGYSLAELERKVMSFGDVRARAAMVCASASCPTLRRKPYTARDLAAQLDAAARSFVSDPNKGARLDRAAGTLHLSSLFKWFESDFGEAGGVLAFVGAHLGADQADFLLANARRLHVVYLEYDWTLNRYDPSR